MLDAGASIYEVSEQMGHSGYRITLDVYAHLIPRDDESHPLDAQPAPRGRTVPSIR
jgi:integrase